MRSAFRLAALATAMIAATSCTDTPVTTGSSATMAHIGIAPSYSPSAVAAYSALAAFAVDVTSIHVHLTAPDGSARDTTVDFPVGLDQITIDLAVPSRTTGQSFVAAIELRAADGTVLFSGTQNVTAQAGGTPTSVAIVPIPITYTGPGSDAATITVTPSASTVTGAGSVQLSASGKTAAGADISNLLVRWTTSDATLATVVSTGNATATVTATGKRGSATISAITVPGKTGTATIATVPAPSRVVVISGGGQTGAAGTALAQPLVVEVQATDNLPVPGVPVTFRAITTGASVGATAPVVSDANGRASTSLTLGPTVGSYQFEAASGTLTVGTATETATQAPAASVTVSGGNFQSVTPAAALPQPLAAKVVDRFGSPVSGATVQWSIASGSGTLGATSSTTNAAGVATVTYKVGTTVGVETVRASLAGVAAPAGEALFTLGVTAAQPKNIVGSGDQQHALAGSALANPLVVTVTDAFGNPAAGFQVKWSVANSGGASATLSTMESVTNASGMAQTSVTLGSTAGAVTIVAVVGDVSFNFTETADAPPNTGNSGTLSGYVYDAVTNAPLSGVTVAVTTASAGLMAAPAVRTTRISRATQQCECIIATTGSDGHFTTAQVAGGDYQVQFSRSGYTPTSIVTLHVDGNTVADAVPLVPASTLPGSISGTIRDATTGNAVSTAVTVELRAGLNAVTGTPLQTTQTNESGLYVFSNISAGTYTVRVVSASYATATKTGISVGAQTTGNQDVFLSPTGVAGSVRIVLTWLASPRDLDSYLTVPGYSTIYYNAKGDCAASPFACLDHDVTSGYGPETVTITQQTAGTYRYSVNQYSGDGTLGTSGARVDLYIDNALARSFSVPAGSGRTWTVFELNGTAITTINQLDEGNGEFRASPSRALIRSGASAGTDAALIRELVRTHPKP
jgi:hypothetical protein